VIFIRQKYKIKRFAKNKAYLSTKFGEALMDKKEVKGLRQGEYVEAYLYSDRHMVLRAIRNLNMKIGGIYSLKADLIDKKGVFFVTDDGLDLFMPFSERTYRINREMTYPVVLKLDDDNRLYLSSKIRDLLSNDHDFKENDLVEGRIYSINKSIGAFVAIDNKYDSLLRIDEMKGIYVEGEEIKARVKEVKHDGKIELSTRQRSYLEIDSDSEMVLKILKEKGGEINIGDKSSPEIIFETFGLSKSSYKRAIGRLYKNKQIEIYDNKIKLRRSNDRK
jgi:predicted RNA-binding protein (virulence factor B family)